MCFSATSSFAAAGMLASIGILALMSVKRPAAYPRALVPLGFALQQACEGIIWITYGVPAYSAVVKYATLLFLICAQIVWPILIPVSLLISERDRVRKGLLFILSCVGIAFGVGAYHMLSTYPVDVRITCHSFAYMYGNLDLLWSYIYFAAYICVTVVPFFVSTLVCSRIIGILSAFALGAAWWSFYATFGSVWCFFAAIVSSLILVQLKLER